MARRGINEILPGKLYQRGTTLTWPRKDKVSMLEERKINIVVNLWPKIDPDYSDTVEWYLYLPITSKGMTSYRIRVMAGAVAKILKKKKKSAALIMCEAGVNRSVFFSALVVSKLLGVPLKEAYGIVEEAVPKHRMKPFMKKYAMER